LDETGFKDSYFLKLTRLFFLRLRAGGVKPQTKITLE